MKAPQRRIAGTPAKKAGLPVEASPAKPKPARISKKVRAAVEAMAGGDVKNWTAAAKKVGMSREHLSREMGKTHVQEFYKQKAFRTISAGVPRAAAVKVALLDSTNEIVKDRASSFILAMSGISPTSEAANRPGAAPAGLTIIIQQPPPLGEPATIDVTPNKSGL